MIHDKSLYFGAGMVSMALLVILAAGIGWAVGAWT